VAVVAAILLEDDRFRVRGLLLLYDHDGAAQRGSVADELGHPGVGPPLAASILVDEAEPREGEVILLKVPLEESITSSKNLPCEFIMAQEGAGEGFVLLRVGLAYEFYFDRLYLFVVEEQ
jgi:hypothetical protein